MRARGGVKAAKCPHTEGKQHDCDYVIWRNLLVPLAAAEADARYPEPVDMTLEDRWRWERKWDSAYHRAMDRLARDPFMQPDASAGMVH